MLLRNAGEAGVDAVVWWCCDSSRQPSDSVASRSPPLPPPPSAPSRRATPARCHHERRVAAVEPQPGASLQTAVLVLPPQLAAQRHRRARTHLPFGVRTQAQRRHRRIRVLLVATQGRRAAAFRDAVVLEVHVRRSRTARVQPLTLHAVARFREQLLGARAVLRRVAVRLHSVVHRPLGVDAVPCSPPPRSASAPNCLSPYAAGGSCRCPPSTRTRRAARCGCNRSPPPAASRPPPPSPAPPHPVGRGLITRGVGVARRVVPRPQQLRPAPPSSALMADELASPSA